MAGFAIRLGIFWRRFHEWGLESDLGPSIKMGLTSRKDEGEGELLLSAATNGW